MHIYDYTFLDGLRLPANLAGLLDSLRAALKRSHAQQEPAPEPDFAGLPGQLREAYDASGAEPLLLVPCVTLDVLCTLPGDPDPHGAAVGLAKALLARSGYPACAGFPLEEKIQSCRFFYQRSLERAAAHWEDNGSDYLCYIEMFLSLLYLCAGELRPAPAAPRRGAKRAAVEDLVLKSKTPVSKAEICASLPQVSPTTVEAVLGAMVRQGTIRKVGAARAARYIRA